MNANSDFSVFTFDSGEILDVLPEPAYDGYEFLGWYTKAEGGDKVTTPYTITTDTELFAHWQLIHEPVTVPEVFLGDADGDGEVTALDVVYVQRYSTFIAVKVDESTLMNADVNRNGSLDILDATWIQRWLVGLNTPYPIGETIS